MILTCNLCGNTLKPFIPLVLDPITLESFSIHRCMECGLGHTIPKPENITRYYEKQYYGKRHGFTSKYCIKRRLRFVTQAMGKQTGKRLLDIGCGDGSFLLAARNKGWNVMGTELNPHSALSASIDVRENLEQVPDGGQFDCITMWHSLEHMPDIKSTLLKLSELIIPNGKLIIAVPDNGGYQAKIFRRRWLHLDVPRHLYHFDADSLQYCLRANGFTIQNQLHQEIEYDLIGWSQSVLNSLFPNHPNIFFNFLTNKQIKNSFLIKISNVILGSFLTGLSLPAVATGTLAGRGGTLIIIAYRTN